MCLAVPGKIIAINGDVATIDYELEVRQAHIVPGESYEIGQYVIVQAGFIISLVDEKEAKDALALYKEATA